MVRPARMPGVFLSRSARCRFVPPSRPSLSRHPDPEGHTLPALPAQLRDHVARPLDHCGRLWITPAGVPPTRMSASLPGEREAGDPPTRPVLSPPALAASGRPGVEPRGNPVSHRSAGGGLPDVPLVSAGPPGAPRRLSARRTRTRRGRACLGGPNASGTGKTTTPRRFGNPSQAVQRVGKRFGGLPPYSAAMELVIGGAIALIGSVIVQAFVIPRVNRRTRAIDRWEQDVLLLGSLVSDQLSVASAEAFHAWTSWRVLRDRPADTFLAGEQIKEIETEDRKRAESFREAWREYERLANVRSDWLAKRIASRDRRHASLYGGRALSRRPRKASSRARDR